MNIFLPFLVRDFTAIKDTDFNAPIDDKRTIVKSAAIVMDTTKSNRCCQLLPK